MIAQIGRFRVLFLMAAEAEYGPELRARFTPVMTGVGPVEGAVATVATLAGLQAGTGLPDLVVSLGSAGSARLEQCTVYQAHSLAYRDMDATALGFEKGVTPFLDLPASLALPHQIAGLPSASLSTGANIVSGAAYDGISEDMVDMESYAVLRACQRFDVPLIALRGISDGAAPLEGLHSWTEYLHIIDARLAEAVDRLRAQLEAGELLG
ncbi:5'-methylthioadenosine/S-adenosylhomocysteine nucleosidase [Roseinatronobacter monicus]|uniref:Adenosylhomocysteine nucleosidase n=1 Tax=Roseinatronobacter monicus TaxID=393481 RepID=A0A543KFN8_9RHOB|nr:5'-methylthioadenosine/S-adenosylhomocysteine nucleosidase [Roseinatronobacter monicus]TQM93885.1 adenosylhomocysteine nucleosidase [Roseinatronobacter monicus]